MSHDACDAECHRSRADALDVDHQALSHPEVETPVEPSCAPWRETSSIVHGAMAVIRSVSIA